MAPNIYNPRKTSPSLTIDAVIAGVRVFEKNGYIHLDYRTTTTYNNQRKRYSTGEKVTKRALVRYERDKYQIALNHFLESNNNNPNATLLFQDIGLKALEEDKSNRQADVQSDYVTIYHKFIEPPFKDRVLSEIRVSDIKAWKNSLLSTTPLSKSRYVKYHRVLNFIFKYAYENELIDKNPMTLVDRTSKLFVKPKNRDSEYYTTVVFENF